ncbi:MAG: hypothetical protein ABSC57_03270 [Syntrophales bacterium]
MKKDGSKIKHIDDLRKRVEKKISGSMDNAGEMPAPEIQRLVHELHCITTLTSTVRGLASP